MVVEVHSFTAHADCMGKVRAVKLSQENGGPRVNCHFNRAARLRQVKENYDAPRPRAPMLCNRMAAGSV